MLELEGTTVEVVLKNIRNIHLTIRHADGRVRISAPKRLGLARVRAFAVSKLAWIRRHQARILKQPREMPPEYVDGEMHYLWGARLPLRVQEGRGLQGVQVGNGVIHLRVRPAGARKAREAVMTGWYRDLVRAEAAPLIELWQAKMGVVVKAVYVRKMRSRWGSCSPRTRTIRLSTALARRPRECFEYVVVHEMAHLLEPGHGARFAALMDHYMPQWREIKKELRAHCV